MLLAAAAAVVVVVVLSDNGTKSKHILSFFVVRMGFSLFEKLMTFKQHPQCNLECCLSFVMMMNDASGEVRGLEDEKDYEVSGVATAMENMTSFEVDPDDEPSENKKIRKEANT